MADLALVGLLAARLKQLEERLAVHTVEAERLALDWLRENVRQPEDGRSPTEDDILALFERYIRQPADGKDATPEMVEAVATRWLAANVRQPADGRNATPEMVESAAAAWLSANVRQPADGKDATPEMVEVALAAWMESQGVAIASEQLREIAERWLAANVRPPADGESAYQIALRHGFRGTESEWLESLKGKADNWRGGFGGIGQAARQEIYVDELPPVAYPALAFKQEPDGFYEIFLNR